MARKRSLDPRDFREVLDAVKGTFDRAGMPWWIQDGTLLGAVRGGGPIPGDYDIDIGMPAGEFRWSLLDRMTDDGFEVRTLSGVQSKDLKVHLEFGGAPIDFFLVYPAGDRWVYWMSAEGLRVGAYITPFGVGRIDFLGLDVPCPDQAERYLEETYGPDWRTPVSRWHYAFAPPNVRPRGGFAAKIKYGYLRARWANAGATPWAFVARQLPARHPGGDVP